MTPATIIRNAKSDGVTISLSTAGKVKAVGNEEAVNRWLPAIRENKDSITSVLLAANDQAPTRLLGTDATVIRAWLASIGEDDRAICGEAIDQCAHDPEALEYFTRRAAEHLQKKAGDATLPMAEDGADDDRITCAQCLMLAVGGACMAAKRGELMTANNKNYRPDVNQLRRCEGYLPRGQGDRRPGRERWPGLTDTKGTK